MSFLRTFLAYVVASAAFLLLAGHGLADTSKPLKGVALVIGQSSYAHLPELKNPANDATAITSLFKDLGFDVTATSNRDAKKLRRDIENFASDAEGADVAVVYYSGHGIEAGGDNWLVPVDADAFSLDNAEKSLVPLSALLDDLRANAALTLVFLDACRTSPFPPGATLKTAGTTLPVSAGGLSLTKGAVAADPGAGTPGLGSLIGFAAEPGMVALDGPADGNSPYAAALLRHLSASTGLEFGTVMRLVTEEVYLKTQGRQRPWVNETLTKLLYFGGKTEDTASDDGKLNLGRRALLLSIDGLDDEMRRTVEQLAKENGLPLDPLYGMLKQLQVDTSKGPEELDKQLRAGVEAVKQLRQEREIIANPDPELGRLTALADRAEEEGAIPLAQDYRAKASARAEVVERAANDNIDLSRKRLREAAATYAKEAETAIVAFDHKLAAEKFAQAFAVVEREDPELALGYKRREADALRDHGNYKGDNDALVAAIAAYGEALNLSPRDRVPLDWALTQNNLGFALQTLGARESGTARLEEAVAAFRAALEERTRDRVPLDWARTQNGLGTALWTLGERENGTARLEEAVTAYRAALEEWTRDRVPLDWARTQNNLGIALGTLGGRESGTVRLEEAVTAYRAALEELTRDRVPLDWAMTQNNLGIALVTLGERESGTARLEEAVTAYRAALEEWTRDRVPLDWAMTQNNLGNALWTLGQRESGTARFQEAVAAYRAALEEWTRDRVPLNWALTQNNLGNALGTLGERESSTARLEEAVAAYRAALAEWTRDRVPLNWAMTQNNLGTVLGTLGERESGTVRLEEAVTAYRAALEERTRDRVPLDWAQTQNNLGFALSTLGERESGTARLEEAVTAYRAALEEETRDRVRLDWAMTQKNLGNALGIIGERSRSNQLVIEGKTAVQAAWDTYKAAGYSQYDDYFSKRIAAFDAILATLAK